MFGPQIFMEYLLYTKYHVKHKGYTDKQKPRPTSQGGYNLVREKDFS